MCLLILAFTAISFRTPDGPPTFISLRDKPFAFSPREFYISAVKDARQDRTAVAALLPVSTGSDSNIKPAYSDFEKGAAEGVGAFISRNLPSDKRLRAVQISIQKLRVEETATSGKVNGKGIISLRFDYARGADDTVHLIDYAASIMYSRPTAQYQDAGVVLSNLIENGLTWFNIWINLQADKNIKLAQGVSLHFSDYTDAMAADTVYYNPQRPLTWRDFTTGFQSRKYDAEVFPVMGYDEQTEVSAGLVQIHIFLKVYLAKESALVKDDAQNDYVLNHEQRHFDIAKIAAERFKKHLQQTVLPVSNYDGPVNVYYLDAYREMHNLQEQYDNETAHGTNHAAQDEWNKRIDAELDLSNPSGNLKNKQTRRFDSNIAN